MKYAKILALAAVAGGALMAFIGVGTASATVLCSTTVDPCPEAQKWPTGKVFDFSVPAGGAILLVDTTGQEIDKCTSSTMKGKITNAGSWTETVTGPITEKKMSSCTLGTTTTKGGGVEIHQIAGTSNGTVVADAQTEAEINTVLFGTCTYTITSGVSYGDITEGNPATFHMNAVAERTAGNPAVCPATAVWSGTYTLTEPAGTTLSVSSS